MEAAFCLPTMLMIKDDDELQITAFLLLGSACHLIKNFPI
jgi:hypothetical protein